MAYYPNQNPASNGQQPWTPYGAPQPPRQPYQPQPGMPANSYGAPLNSYQQTPYQQWPQARQQMPRRPYILALFAFPFQCLSVYALPTPATFAREKERVGWSLIWTLLLVLAMIAGAGTYLWGRLPRLVQGIQSLSLGHVIPQPLSPGICFLAAVAAPCVFLILVGFMHWFSKSLGGKGSYRAQSYTALLIGTPLLVTLFAIALLLTLNPALGNSLHLAFAGTAAALVVYTFILHIMAVKAVQQLGTGKATLVVFGTALIVVVIALLVMALGDLFTDSGSNHGSGSSHSSGSHSGGDHSPDIDLGGDKRTPANRVMLFCPNCGMRSAAPVPQMQALGICPRCGTPTISV